MIASLVLPETLRAQISDEARIAFPRECCGLIEGIHARDAIRVTALHATPNLAGENDRFEIDPSAQIRLLRALRGTGRGIVGCYHSHPNGSAVPSPRDAEQASERDFVWLVLGVGAQTEIGAFVWDGAAFRELHLAAAS